jgi:ATP-binding cassette subfamily F protein uup
VQLGYYDQRSADLNEQLRLIEFIEREAPLIRTKEGEILEAAQMLEWFLFPRAMQYARISSLSGGERRRLYLLRTLMHQPNVLFLDEPTNDLDIQTLTVLEEFLDHFRGCLVVVSHDRYFLDRTVDFLVTLEQGSLGPRYTTPYATYLRLRAEAAALLAGEKTAPEPERVLPKPSSGRPKLSWKEQRELESLEAAVATLEEEKVQLTSAVSQSGNDYIKLQTLSKQLEQLETKLADTLERWLQLADKGA